MNSGRPRLAFISPVFLFPNDAGGKIRSTNILRGLQGGAFDVTLLCPATPDQEKDARGRFQPEIASVCDEFITWRATPARPHWRRSVDLLAALPVNVAADRTAPGLRAVAELARRTDIDVMVFDFVHSAVLRPDALNCASVCFTHNVEAEIFARHAQRARGWAKRWLWSSQHAKMLAFEAAALRGFTAVVAVSERDAQYFREVCGVASASAIPTGVDLRFFDWAAPPLPSAEAPPTVVFTGSMDWPANVDGVKFFIEEVWPRVLAGCAQARFVVVGRNPPAALVALARRSRQVEFTGFVDDVRPHVHAAHAFVIPLFVGGGTRIKAFEAMAMGCPVVSTTIGIEGLDAEPEAHYLRRDDAASIAAAVLDLLRDDGLRRRLSGAARALVERRFGHEVVARVFEAACLEALAVHRTRAGSRPVRLRSGAAGP